MGGYGVVDRWMVTVLLYLNHVCSHDLYPGPAAVFVSGETDRFDCFVLFFCFDGIHPTALSWT